MEHCRQNGNVPVTSKPSPEEVQLEKTTTATPATPNAIDGAGIRRIREAIPMSLVEWSKALKVSRITALRWEIHGARPRPAKVRKILAFAAKHGVAVR